MKPLEEHISEDINKSFRCRHFEQDSFKFILHRHQEYELTLILEGSGRRFVGDNISEFAKGDLVFIGPNLPHTWYSKQKGETIVIQFKESFLGNDFITLPEMRNVKNLFENSTYGLTFGKKTSTQIGKKILTLEKTNSIKKIITLLEILEILSSTNDVVKLSKKRFTKNSEAKNVNRIDSVFSYINKNFTKKISLDDISEIATMSPNSFCRFFKTTTGKSFSTYVAELRIGIACKQLIETDFPISEICYNSGYMNLSNFNRKFLEIKGISPSKYRKEFITNDGIEV